MEQFWLKAVRTAGWQVESEGSNIFLVTQTVPYQSTGDEPIPELFLAPYHLIVHENAGVGLRYVDMWWNGVQDTFTGKTFIQQIEGERSLWQMNYEGWLPSEHTELVRAAIAAAVKTGKFCGGRGPDTFRVNNEGLLYSNWVVSTLDRPDPNPPLFQSFKGKEYVADLPSEPSFSTTKTKLLAVMTYRGGILLPDDDDYIITRFGDRMVDIDKVKPVCPSAQRA